MEELITRIVDNRELIFDALESVELYIWDSREIQLIIISLLFIIVLSFWTLYERLEIRGWKSLIPIYRWVVLFKALGMKPWLSVFLLIPGINLIMIIALYINMARVFKRSYFMVPGLFICPLLFIPVVAFGNGKCDHYQPHARYVDTPVETRQNQPIVVEQRKTTEKTDTKQVIEKKLPIQETINKPRIAETKPIQIKIDGPDVIAPIGQQIPKEPSKTINISVMVLDDGEPITITPNMINKKRHIDFVSKTRRRVAKPVEKVLLNPHHRRVLQPISTIQPQPKRPTRPMPGDIRPMRNNVVVVGALSEALPPVAPRIAPTLHPVCTK